MTSDEVYPNSPLQGVVFEIRFPGEPAIECHRDQFFEKVRAEFPQVLVPKLRDGEGAALAPYHFQPANDSAALMTALNLFAYRTNAYSGYAQFRGETLRWLQVFRTLFPIGKLTRTGLRYTNVIPFPPGQGFPIDQYLKLKMSLGERRAEGFQQFFMTTRIPAGSGTLTVQLGHADVPAGHAIVLDFDFAKEGELHIADIGIHLDESHQTEFSVRGSKHLRTSLLAGRPHRGFRYLTSVPMERPCG